MGVVSQTCFLNLSFWSINLKILEMRGPILPYPIEKAHRLNTAICYYQTSHDYTTAFWLAVLNTWAWCACTVTEWQSGVSVGSVTWLQQSFSRWSVNWYFICYVCYEFAACHSRCRDVNEGLSVCLEIVFDLHCCSGASVNDHVAYTDSLTLL